MRACTSLALAILAIAPAAADAATFHVAPGGSGTACTQAAPCDLRYAGTGGRPGTGGELVLAAGEYDLGTTPVTLVGGLPGVTVRGAGARRTTIRGDRAPLRVGPGSLVQDLRIADRPGGDNGTTLFSDDTETDRSRTVIERVIAETGRFDAIGFTTDGLVRDTLAISRGDGGAAVAVFADRTVRLQGVTAISARGPAAVATDTGALGLRNSIARTLADGQLDLELTASGRSIAVAYSSFRADRVSPGVTRIGTVHFDGVDAQLDTATGRLARTSPLRDVGDPAAELSERDVLGRPRRLGAAPDVGAVELLPVPRVGTAAATRVGTDRATIAAPVDPRGFPVQARLEVAGRTIDLGTVDAARTVTTEVTGLSPATDHSARVVVRHEEGEVASAPVAFRTATPQAPPTTTGPLTTTTATTSTTPAETTPPVTPAPPPAATPAPPPPAQVGAPQLERSARLGSTSLRPGGRATLTTTSDRAGRLRLVVERLVPGRRRARSCVAPSRARRGRRCTRAVVVLRRSLPLAAGTTARSFALRRRGRPLPAGRYVLRADVAGRVLRIGFRVVR